MRENAICDVSAEALPGGSERQMRSIKSFNEKNKQTNKQTKKKPQKNNNNRVPPRGHIYRRRFDDEGRPVKKTHTHTKTEKQMTNTHKIL